MVSERGIEVDQKKNKEIVEMKPSKTKRNPRIFGKDTIHKQVHSLAHYDMRATLSITQKGRPYSIEVLWHQ